MSHDPAAELEKLLCQVDALKPHQVAEHDAVIRQIDQLHDEHRVPETLYGIAYAWYFHPDRLRSPSTLKRVAIQRRVEDILLDVLRSVPDDFLSYLYLGHNRYDIGDYAMAKRYFEGAMLRCSRSYLGLKALEMVASCDVRMHGLVPALPIIRRFVVAAESYPVEDIFPNVLARAIRERHDRMPLSELQTCRELAARLDAVGHFGRWFGELFDDERFVMQGRTREFVSSGEL